MIRSLRSRLFVAILGTVLIAIGASLALGVLLTKSAVRNTIAHDVERQAESFSRQVSILPSTVLARLERAGAAVNTTAAQDSTPGAPLATQPSTHADQLPLQVSHVRPPPALSGQQGPPAQVLLTRAAAANLIPRTGILALERSGAANGTMRLRGAEQIYAARRVRGAVALVVRPDVVSGEDFRRYLIALLIASGVAAALAAAVAALLTRRLVSPLRRLAAAAVELASGGRPDPVPPGGTVEVDELASSFNEMSEQLALARDAERGLLLSVSHDLRTPLTSIRGYAEGIEDGTVEPREGAAVLAREAARLERLVGDLLALARLRQGVLAVRREPVDLAAIAHEAEVRLRPRAAERSVHVEVGGEQAPALADHDRVLQILTNLLDNALKISPAGETVWIRTRPGSLAVCDRGPGIPDHEIPRAFERFHLRSRLGAHSSGGAGLGLAIVRELAEAMGGSATVENIEGGGARFTVNLPLPPHAEAPPKRLDTPRGRSS